jgi:hypothetical protein
MAIELVKLYVAGLPITAPCDAVLFKDAFFEGSLFRTRISDVWIAQKPPGYGFVSFRGNQAELDELLRWCEGRRFMDCSPRLSRATRQVFTGEKEIVHRTQQVASLLMDHQVKITHIADGDRKRERSSHEAEIPRRQQSPSEDRVPRRKHSPRKEERSFKHNSRSDRRDKSRDRKGRRSPSPSKDRSSKHKVRTVKREKRSRSRSVSSDSSLDRPIYHRRR